MNVTDLGLHSLALFFYPGLLSVLLVGLGTELGLRRLDREPAGASRSLRLEKAGNLSLAGRLAILLAALAATQLGAPFNPVPAAERSALLAAVCVAGAGWAIWSGDRARRGEQETPAGGLLLPQLCWMLALLGPAVAAGTFRPTAIGSVAVPVHLALKSVAGLLFLASLPAVLLLLDAPPAGWPERVARAALWLPACALGASVLLAPVGDDLPGALRFAAETIVVGLVATVLGRLLPARRRAYTPLLLLLSGATALLTVLASRLA